MRVPIKTFVLNCIAEVEGDMTEAKLTEIWNETKQAYPHRVLNWSYVCTLARSVCRSPYKINRRTRRARG